MTNSDKLTQQTASVRELFECKRGEIYIRYQEEIVYCEGGDVLAEVAQRSCG